MQLVATVALVDAKVALDFPEGSIRVDLINSQGSIVASSGLAPDGTAGFGNPVSDTYTAASVYVDGQGNEFGTKQVSAPFSWTQQATDKTIQVPASITLSAA